VSMFLRQLQATPITPPGTLQSTLSSASSGTDGGRLVGPHHPITCPVGELRYEEDGSFSCDHAVVEPHDPRTQACIVHSMALLIIELVKEL
jgi:hypothetical protein